MISPDDFVHTIAELKTTIFDRYSGLMPGKESPIDKCNIRHDNQPFPVGAT